MRRFAATVGVFGLAVVISAVLLELGVLLFLGPQVRFPRRVVGSEFGLRINEPHARYGHRSPDVSVEFRINGQGMRDDREFAYAKPQGVKRIVSLGDSFTAGFEVEGDETFSSVLERALAARGIRVEVLNAGVSGYSNAEALLYLERELYRYEPDLVLLSFFGNDLVDNTRTGLFRLEDGRLVEVGTSYVPGGGIGDFLNTNPLFSFLSEHSNAFALAKEVATLALKRRMVEENLEQISAGAGDDAVARDQRRLAAAIFERLYAGTRERGIPLVIQSIPTPAWGTDGKPALHELFPLDEFDVERPGIAFFPARSVLEPSLGREPLYHLRSHGHWTPYSHRLAGEALAALVVERGLLE